MTDILYAAAMIGGVGLFVGIFLGFAGKVFAVKVNQKEKDILDVLPGANCGGCGYSGCAALAAAIARGEAGATSCVVGQEPVANQIRWIIGGKSERIVRNVAFVRCSGDCSSTFDRYEYTGPRTCAALALAPEGGPKSCFYGCIGCGDCVAGCEYGAIYIERGVAVVDEDKCLDCRKCIKTCPKGLIVEVPYYRASHVGCVNPLKGKAVMENCKIGCISCGKCAKNCHMNAIDLSGGYPVIDYDKCDNCGTCRDNCPRHCIV